jgi:hypothetical protein
LALGETVEQVAADTRIGKRHLLVWLEAIGEQGFYAWLRKPAPEDIKLKRSREGLAQMLLCLLAEHHFESLAAGVLGPGGFRIEDHRVGRTDTDYRLLEPNGRPLFRLNIKFHGTLFERAREYVGLAPEDCFALATYKISAALKRQDDERLPYLFLIISVPQFPRESIETSIDVDWVWLASITGRDVEEAIIGLLSNEAWTEPIRQRLADAEFRVLSARRAYNLMREQLFSRVNALRLRGFNRLFRGAEINMHLSLSGEMIAYRDLLEMIASRGPVEVALRLDRGEI